MKNSLYLIENLLETERLLKEKTVVLFLDERLTAYSDTQFLCTKNFKTRHALEENGIPKIDICRFYGIKNQHFFTS